MKSKFLLLSALGLMVVTASGVESRADTSEYWTATVCPKPVSCDTADACRRLRSAYYSRGDQFIAARNRAKNEKFRATLLKQIQEDRQCGADAKKKQVEFEAECADGNLSRCVKDLGRILVKAMTPTPDKKECDDFKSCHALAKTNSARVQAKIEENRDLYKTDYKKAKANEAEIRDMNKKTRQALDLARAAAQ